MGATHDAESNVEVPFFHEGRDNGVERALPSGQFVRMSPLETEERATILQWESHTAHDDPRTKVLIVALNPTDDVALAIDYRKISRIAVRQSAGRIVTAGLVGIDELRALGGILLRNQDGCRHFDE